MKLLADRFGRTCNYLRISVTDRCNLRCQYCMPSTGITVRPRGDILTFDEIERLAVMFARLGISKIRLTGGEPLVRKDLADLVRRLVQIPGIGTVALTTNGVLLKEHCGELKQAGLSSVNVSLDTLRRERFTRIALRSYHDEVLAGIDTALDIGFSPLKLNVVVMGGINDDEVLDFVEFVRHRPLDVRFIEYMPFKSNSWTAASFIPSDVIKARIEQSHVLHALHRGDPSSVAREFRVDGWIGTVSFISAMSHQFCDTCNRLRLTADGSIKSCLFHRAEVNLRHALRNGAPDDVLEDMIRSAVILKPAGHAPVEQLIESDDRSMVEIGG